MCCVSSYFYYFSFNYSQTKSGSNNNCIAVIIELGISVPQHAALWGVEQSRDGEGWSRLY